MVTLGILHATLPTYMKQSAQEDGRHFEVVLAEDNPDLFSRGLQQQSPQVLIVDLALLGDEPEATLAHFEKASGAELTTVVYAFAKWDLVERLRGPKRQVMRAPISVRALRSNLVNLIVRELSRQKAEKASAETTTQAGSPGIQLAAPARARRYDDVQLASLQEIQSQVDCECPNQVADLVLALNAFEDYSNQCKNRNADDARMHARLAQLTGHARSVMEQALKELCLFENINPDDLPQRAS